MGVTLSEPSDYMPDAPPGPTHRAAREMLLKGGSFEPDVLLQAWVRRRFHPANAGAGFGAVSFNAGAFSLRLELPPAELRRVATLLTNVADDIEAADLAAALRRLD